MDDHRHIDSERSMIGTDDTEAPAATTTDGPVGDGDAGLQELRPERGEKAAASGNEDAAAIEAEGGGRVPAVLQGAVEDVAEPSRKDPTRAEGSEESEGPDDPSQAHDKKGDACEPPSSTSLARKGSSGAHGDSASESGAGTTAPGGRTIAEPRPPPPLLPAPSLPPPAEAWASSLASPAALLAAADPADGAGGGRRCDRRRLYGFAVRRLHERACSLSRRARAEQAPALLAIADLYDGASRALQSAGLGAGIGRGPASQNTGTGTGGGSHQALGEYLRGWGADRSKMYGDLSRSVRERSHGPLLALSVAHADALSGADQRWGRAVRSCRGAQQKGPAPDAPASGEQGLGEDPAQPGASLEALLCQRLEQMVLEQHLLLETDRVRTVGPCLRQFLEDSRGAVMDGWPCVPSPSAAVVPPRAVDSATEGTDAGEEDPSSSFGGDDDDFGNAGAADATGDPSTPPSPTQQQQRQRRKKLFSKRRDKDGATGGAMDAETLGLPEEIGRLRDQARARIAARSDRLQVVRALAGFLENAASAHAKLGSGLRQVYEEARQPPPPPQSPTLASVFLAGALPSSFPSFTEASGDLTVGESPALQKFWGDIVAAVEVESKSSLALAASLRALRSDKLDRALLYGERTIKAATELDDSLWKQLCDAARHQSRTEARYRQVSEQTAKMRERVKSQDSDPGSKHLKKEPSKVNKHVSKSIANMFSILPDGGAEALRIFAPGARATIAAHSLEEADSRESNRRQQLDAAVETTAKCAESYKRTAAALVKQYDDDEAEAWEGIRSVLDGIASSSASYRTARLSSLAEVEPLQQDFRYLEEYRAELQSKLDLLLSDISDDDNEGLTQKFDGSPTSGPFATSRNDDTMDDESSNDVNSVTSASTLDKSEASQSKSNANYTSPPRSSNPDGDDRESDGPWHQKMTLSPQKSVSSLGNEFLRLASSVMDASPTRDPSNQLSLETEAFLSFFWQDPVDRSKVPQVLESFPCSFRDSSQRFPSQYGRLFLTKSRIIFNSWTGRKLSVSWSDLKNVERVASTYDDSVLLTTKKTESEDQFSILGGLYDRTALIELICRLRDDASIRRQIPSAQEAPPSIPSLEPALAVPVPPDETLKKMNIVLSRHLKSISVQRFYEIAWSEEEKPFYEPWLSRVCFDINMGRWKLERAVGPWCGESYDQKRVITFKVKRRTHLYIGPPIANVMQTHYCRREGNDKCVLGMTVEFEGMPYADTFRVEVRWVARREGTQDIQVDVGVFVDFRKSTILKSKIQAGTLDESTCCLWKRACRPAGLQNGVT
jgi:hypothetical protein